MVEKLRARLLEGPGGVERPFTPDEMLAAAAAVDLDALDLRAHVGFRDDGYARNVVTRNEHFELVVICWKAGQSSPIHDHGRSYCLYLVTDGEMCEEVYERAGTAAGGESGNGDRVRCTVRRSWPRGAITLAEGRTIHRVLNRTDRDLVTVHVYSPPLPFPPRTFEEAPDPAG